MIEIKNPVVEKIGRSNELTGKVEVEKVKKQKNKQIEKIKKTTTGTVKGFFSPKVLRKPKARPIKKLSAKRLIQQMGREQGALVREVENPYENPVQDNRSQFFREEFRYEERKSFGGFL